MSWLQFGQRRKIADAPEIAQLGRLTDETLRFARGYIKQHQLSEAGQGLSARLAYIEQQRISNTFNLAVIGEFNSGKSTLINALINEDLLSHGPEPVTANPTHVRYDRHFDVQATFEGIGRLSLRADKRRILEVVGALQPAITPSGDETRDLIASLTADTAVARATTDCVISHDDAFLRDGVVIVDTAGLNDREELEQSTVSVIQNEADLCLVVIDGQYPGQMTLITFLREYLRPLLHRCVFVVSKMEMEHDDPRERPRNQELVLNDVAHKLAQLGLHDPTLYPVGAQTALLRLQKQSLSANQSFWADQFNLMRQELAQRLRQDRQLAVLERLIGLLTGILSSLDGEMALQQQVIAQQAKALISLPDIEVFANQERSRAFAGLDNAATAEQRALRARMASIQEQAQHAAANAIWNSGDRGALHRVARKGIDRIMRQYPPLVVNALEASAAEVDAGAKDAATRFLTRFSDVYARLQSLAHKPKAQAAAQGQAAPTLAPASPSVTAAQAFKDASKGGSAFWGAVIGALLGSIVPGIGTLIGAVVGGMIGNSSRPSLDQIKTSVQQQVTPAIAEQFEKWEREALKQLEDRRQLRQSELARLIDNYIAQYRKAYAQVEELQRQERLRLEAAMAGVQRERDDVSQRRAMLEASLKAAIAPVAIGDVSSAGAH